MTSEIPWKTFSETYGFIGNSLLRPMTQTSTAGLDPAFWTVFPTFGDEDVAVAVKACYHFAEGAQCRTEAGEDVVEWCAVEYTRLFVGPPAPAAPPWETMYRGQNVTVGFGQATFEMRVLLRDAGLKLCNENRQYEDHLGIELLYLSELCRSAKGPSAPQIATFIGEHPQSWIDAFSARIAEASPDGYLVNLTRLASAVLACHQNVLSR